MPEDNETENKNIAEEEPEGIGDPVAVSTNCYIESSTAIVRCSTCGTRCRINLLAEEASQCPGCENQYSSALLITDPEDVDAIADLVQTIDGAESDDDDQNNEEQDSENIKDAQPAERKDTGEESSENDK